MSAELSFVFFTIHGQADGRTDGFTIAKTALHTVQRGNLHTDVTHDKVTKKKTSEQSC